MLNCKQRLEDFEDNEKKMRKIIRTNIQIPCHADIYLGTPTFCASKTWRTGHRH